MSPKRRKTSSVGHGVAHYSSQSSSYKNLGLLQNKLNTNTNTDGCQFPGRLQRTTLARTSRRPTQHALTHQSLHTQQSACQVTDPLVPGALSHHLQVPHRTHHHRHTAVCLYGYCKTLYRVYRLGRVIDHEGCVKKEPWHISWRYPSL